MGLVLQSFPQEIHCLFLMHLLLPNKDATACNVPSYAA